MNFSAYHSDTPEAVVNAQGIHLLTQNTPNGQKIQIFLEELADAYGTQWTTTLIDTNTNKQKKDWFLALNPNGRIPVIVDGKFPIMETSAQLLYLLKFDKGNHFSFEDPLEHSELVQWLFFWHGSGAPYQGNLTFFRKAKEQNRFAIERFQKETWRVFGVLEIHLSGKYSGMPKDYLAGKGKGKFTVADIGTWAWVKNWPGSGYTPEQMSTYPSLLAWIERIAARPAVQRGIGTKYHLP